MIGLKTQATSTLPGGPNNRAVEIALGRGRSFHAPGNHPLNGNKPDLPAAATKKTNEPPNQRLAMVRYSASPPATRRCSIRPPKTPSPVMGGSGNRATSERAIGEALHRPNPLAVFAPVDPFVEKRHQPTLTTKADHPSRQTAFRSVLANDDNTHATKEDCVKNKKNLARPSRGADTGVELTDDAA